MAIVPTAALWRVRFTRLRLERKGVVQRLNTSQMMMRLGTTGSELRSLLRRRAMNADSAPPTPWLAMSRLSCRSAGRLACSAAGLLGESGRGHGQRQGALMVGAAGRPLGHGSLVAPVMAAMMSRRWSLLTLKTPLLRPSSKHGHPVGDGHDVGHVVADQDHAVTALTQPFHEGLSTRLSGPNAEGRGGLVEHHDLGLAESSDLVMGYALPCPPDRSSHGDTDRGHLGQRLGRSRSQEASLHPRTRQGLPAPAGARARGRGWHDVEVGSSARSWNTVAMPRRWASAGVETETGASRRSRLRPGCDARHGL